MPKTNKLKLVSLCCAWYCFLGHLHAQNNYSLKDTFSHYLKEKPSFYFSLDGRSSFVRNKPATIDGIRFGLNYGGKIRLLLGFYDLRRPIYRDYIYAQATPNEERRTQRSDFFYLGITCDYVLYNTKRWKLALPVKLGYGLGSRIELNESQEIKVNKQLRFVPLEVSLWSTYRITPWLHAGAGLGYRYALFNSVVSGDFSAPIYSYGISLDVEWLYEKYVR